VCIYVDVVITNQPGMGPDNNRKIVLIIIALYGTAQMFIKLFLAICHHVWWMISRYSRCCRAVLEEGRKERVDALWKTLKEEYAQIEAEILAKNTPHSMMIRRVRR
jgi:hypothetical protein